MRPIRNSSNVSNFYLISDHRTTTSPFSQNKILFKTSKGSGFPSCSIMLPEVSIKVCKSTFFSKEIFKHFSINWSVIRFKQF